LQFSGENAMTRLPKAQRDKLILAILGTAVVLAALYFGAVSGQLGQISELKAQRDQKERDAKNIEDSVHNAKKIETELGQKTAELKTAQGDMASGDAYLWMVNTIRQFKIGYDVDISQFSGISNPEVSLYPHFPYKQVSITIGGTAYYHDLGRFIADFENHFQHMRIQNLSLEPSPAPTGTDRQKLSFRMQIVALENSNT
jgi:Tfp pilus assembly protein PilO